jgi:hypothetical protein
MMQLISGPICDAEDVVFLQRHFGGFVSSKVRSSTAGLAIPECLKKQKSRRIENAGDIFRAFNILVCSLNPKT